MRRSDSSSILIPGILMAGMFACVPAAMAQDTPDPPGSVVTEEDSTAERRVRRLGDVSGNEFELDLAVPEAPPADVASSAGLDLPDAERNRRLQELLSILATAPGQADALAQLDELLSEVLVEANIMGDAGRLGEMAQQLRVVRHVNPNMAGLDDASQWLKDLQNVERWLAAGNAALDGGFLVEPTGESALYHFRRVLETDPANEQAEQGLLGVQLGLVDRALEAARDFDFDLAADWLEEASLVREPQELVEEALLEIAAFREEQANGIEQNILDAIIARDFDYAEFILIDLIALGGFEDRVARLRERLAEARMYGQFKPGDVINDFFPDSGIAAPPVVVIPTGSFLMGSMQNEDHRSDSEGPKHRVTITRGFAIGLREVSVAQFSLFAQSSGYKTHAELEESSWVFDEKSGRMTSRTEVNWRHDFRGRRAGDDQPVLHVDWHDAQAYVNWLSRETRQSYRLPSEAEWEYVIRAGSVSPYWWGNGTPPEVVENLMGDGDTSSSGRSWGVAFENYADGYWGPAPTGSYPPNAFGLHDLAGNVSEWIEDCWHDTYVRAPLDGSAWVNPGCKQRVVRGGYWAGKPGQARSAARFSAEDRLRGPRVGIRVARDL